MTSEGWGPLWVDGPAFSTDSRYKDVNYAGEMSCFTLAKLGE